MINKSKSKNKVNKNTIKVKKPVRDLILVITDAPIRKTKRKPRRPRNRKPRKIKRSKK